jgi:hypothetical protein
LLQDPLNTYQRPIRLSACGRLFLPGEFHGDVLQARDRTVLNVADDRERFGSKLVSLGRHNFTTDCRAFAGVGGVEPSRHKIRKYVALPVLDKILQSGGCADLAFICGENGSPLTKESFGNAFRNTCNAEGVTKAAHGVRKIGATRAATDGATVAELEAIFVWQGDSLSTRAADRARLVKGAMAKLDRTPDEQSIPAPSRKVRESEQKDQLFQSFRRFAMVRSRGLEPPRVAPLAPQASASTTSATTAGGLWSRPKARRRATAHHVTN